MDLAGANAEQLRRHWTQVSAERMEQPGADDVFSYNLMSLSRADYDQVRALQLAFFREVRSIAAASTPSECAVLLTWHVVKWNG